MHGVSRYLIAGLLLALCLLGSVQSASASHLSGTWLYHEGDEGASERVFVHEAACGARNWAMFDFPARPPLTEEAHVVYLTTQVLPGGDADTLFFFLAGESVRVFYGEQQVYAYDASAPTTSGGGRTWHLVHLPQSAIPCTLTIELLSADSERLGILHSFQFGTEEEAVRQVFLSDLGLILTLPVTVCMFLIVVLFCRSEKEGRALYRALLAFLGNFFLWGIAALNTKYFLAGQFVSWWYVLMILAYFLPITSYGIVYEVLQGRQRRFVGWFIVAFSVLFLVALAMELFGLGGLRQLFPLYFMLLALFGAAISWWTLQGARRGDDYCRTLLVPIVMFTVLGVVDGFNVYWHFLPGDMYLSPFGIYGIAVFLLAILRHMIHHEEELGEEETQLRGKIAAARNRETHDALTHALSRAVFRHLLDRYLARAASKREALSLIMLDVDHFKQINDTYGHEVGDQVLIDIVKAIHVNLTVRCPLIRWGGEEFFVCCPGMPLAEAAALADVLRHALKTVRAAEQTVTASFGVATWHGASDTADALCARVDAALYAAKQGGRDRVALEVEEG